MFIPRSLVRPLVGRVDSFCFHGRRSPFIFCSLFALALPGIPHVRRNVPTATEDGLGECGERGGHNVGLTHPLQVISWDGMPVTTTQSTAKIQAERVLPGENIIWACQQNFKLFQCEIYHHLLTGFQGDCSLLLVRVSQARSLGSCTRHKGCEGTY